MLVLTRKRNESVVVECGGEVVEITLTEVRDRNSVRIGISAPQHFKILRKELLPKSAKEVQE